MIMENVYWSCIHLYRDNGKEHGNYYIVYWGYIGIMEKNMEAIMLGSRFGVAHLHFCNEVPFAWILLLAAIKFPCTDGGWAQRLRLGSRVLRAQLFKKIWVQLIKTTLDTKPLGLKARPQTIKPRNPKP